MSKLKFSGKDFGLNAINIYGAGSVRWLVWFWFGQGKQFSRGEFYWLCKHELYSSLMYFLSSNLFYLTHTHLQRGTFAENG